MADFTSESDFGARSNHAFYARTQVHEGLILDLRCLVLVQNDEILAGSRIRGGRQIGRDQNEADMHAFFHCFDYIGFDSDAVDDGSVGRVGTTMLIGQTASDTGFPCPCGTLICRSSDTVSSGLSRLPAIP
jgi:hypothetical protein